MRITDVTAFALRWEKGSQLQSLSIPTDEFGDYYIGRDAWTSIYSRYHETMIVRIATAEGIVGYGEGQSPISPRTSKTIVEDLCRPILMGRDPFDVEVLWQRMFSGMRERGHPTGFFIDALAGCDLALWDIVGKETGKPAHKLLGGRFRDRVPVYTGFRVGDPDAAAARAAEYIAEGYRAFKLSVRNTAPEIIAVVAAVRDRVGPDIDLMVDVHTLFSVPDAIALGRQLERYQVRWLEAPTVPEDIKGQAEIARALDMAVASGEWSRTRFELREAFERRAFDIVMPDIARTGLTEGEKIASLADTYNIPVSPHVGGGGILSVVATIQFSASIPNFLIMEHSHATHDAKGQIIKNPPAVADSAFIVDDRPGLGVNVDESTLSRLSIE